MIFPHLMLSAYSQLCLLSTSSSFLYVFWLLITRPVNQPALYCELGLLRETWTGSVTIIPVGQSSCEAPIKGSWACYRWVTSIQPPVMSGEITEVNRATWPWVETLWKKWAGSRTRNESILKAIE